MDYKDKLVLVTGSGFLGTELTKRLIEKEARVRVMARNEGNLLKLQAQYPSIEIFTGDIADSVSVQQAMNGVDGVISTSATKIVGLSEKFVRETIRTNILGSLNILEQATKQHLDFLVGISTDKAVGCNGVYACSKFLMQKAFEQFQDLLPETRVLVLVYGNILLSTNSVLTVWKRQIEAGEPVYLNSPDATRYWWKVSTAAQFIFDSIDAPPQKEPYAPTDMKGMSVRNLLEAAIIKWGNGKPVKVIEGNLIDADNLHEVLVKGGKNSSQVEQFSVEEMVQILNECSP